MKNTFEIIGGLIILTFMGVVLWQILHMSKTDSDQPVACTAEAKLCPDGSSVGRVGPNCEFSVCPESSAADLTSRSEEFRFALEEMVRIEIGQPIEGYEPAMFVQVLPGLEPQDFDGAEAQIGYYQYSEGELRHELGEVEVVHSAAPAMTEEGIKTLLDNVTSRLDVDPEVTSVEEVIAELKKPSEKDVVHSVPVPSPTPMCATKDENGELVMKHCDSLPTTPLPVPDQPVACTMDAKQCPDGSFVGRVGPDCEFAACPASEFPIRYGQDTSRLEEYRSDCENRMGVFNECGSACGPEAETCVLSVCSMICEGPANEHMPPVPTESVFCSPESKLVEMCTMEYAPVCGLVEVQCVTTPCDPIPQTFGNDCSACAQGNVISYTEGACENDI